MFNWFLNKLDRAINDTQNKIAYLVSTEGKRSNPAEPFGPGYSYRQMVKRYMFLNKIRNMLTNKF